LSRPVLGSTQPPVQWVPRVLSPGLKRGQGVTLTTHPHLVPRLRISRILPLLPPSPPSAIMTGAGTALLFWLFTYKSTWRCTQNTNIDKVPFPLPLFVFVLKP